MIHDNEKLFHKKSNESQSGHDVGIDAIEFENDISALETNTD